MIKLEFEPIRPRAASVVAVVWLYLGASWLGIAFVMLPAFVMMSRFAGTFFFWPVGAFWLAIAAIAAFALRSALQLLQLRASGRRHLEWANWATFALLMLFTLHFCSLFGSVPSPWGYSTYFDATRVVFPFLGGTLTSLPFVLMARALRSEEVRFAVRDAELRRPAWLS